jgi:hypothetical protein
MMSNPFAFAQVRMWLTPVVLRWLNVAARGLMLALFVYTASQKIASPDVFRKELAYSPLIPSSLATITF